MKKKRKHISMRNQVRGELAQKHYLNPDSPGYLNELKARKLAGYSDSYSKSASGSLWRKIDIDSISDILPDGSQNIGEELKKWLELVAKWRKKLNEVEDPAKLGSHTFAVVASYIERLAKIFGLIIDRQEKREFKAKTEERHVYLHFKTKEEEFKYYNEVEHIVRAKKKEIMNAAGESEIITPDA